MTWIDEWNVIKLGYKVVPPSYIKYDGNSLTWPFVVYFFVDDSLFISFSISVINSQIESDKSPFGMEMEDIQMGGMKLNTLNPSSFMQDDDFINCLVNDSNFTLNLEGISI